MDDITITKKDGTTVSLRESYPDMTDEEYETVANALTMAFMDARCDFLCPDCGYYGEIEGFDDHPFYCPACGSPQ